MELSLEQRIVFDKYVQSNNIFITGPGGTGKSTQFFQYNGNSATPAMNFSFSAQIPSP